MPSLSDSIHERYLHTLDRISAAEKRAGRAPGSVKLVVVTKSQLVETVRAALEAGVKILGENYPEEAVAKIKAIGAADVEWHMIGHVQSRKADLIPRNFSLLHSLDSIKLATRLDRFVSQAGSHLPALLEFNVGEEESKFGWVASDESRWPELLPEIDMVLKLKKLTVRGLMTMPPLFDDPERTRPYFQKLRRLRDFLAQNFPAADWSELSMGTSADFDAAVEEGATLVRVGTAIVGPRPPKA
ncbi:MAG: YggS family pyridoxal phosphate-dependent enzyme [Anaerolineaceae bacterium]|nr:MAG: YggS family pyridoxal phosphate-dependent enzyme [Anaerolineaceae bacterium]